MCDVTDCKNEEIEVVYKSLSVCNDCWDEHLKKMINLDDLIYEKNIQGDETKMAEKTEYQLKREEYKKAIVDYRDALKKVMEIRALKKQLREQLIQLKQ
jgi:hypothetical protein